MPLQKERLFYGSLFPTYGTGGSVSQFSNSPVSCDSTVDTFVDPDPEFPPIPDSGVKKAPDPGSGSAALLGLLKDMVRVPYSLVADRSDDLCRRCC